MRTKDLVDLVLLIERGLLDVVGIRRALLATFTARATHNLPASLLPPPVSWAVDFPGLATEAGLSTIDYLEAFEILVKFWDAGSLGEA